MDGQEKRIEASGRMPDARERRSPMAETKGKKKKAPNGAKAAPANAPKVAAKGAPGATAIDVDALHRRDDQRDPDTTVTTLANHAETLANTVRTHLSALAAAKVTGEDAARLDALAVLLRGGESTWRAAWKAVSGGDVATARTPLLIGRNDLFGAIEAFAEDDAAQQALVEIGGVDSDDDLEVDTGRLIELARRYAGDLAGTEITPARVGEVEAALGAFRAARKGERSKAGAETTKQELTEAARQALERRNRVFWALSALDRRVCRRGKFRFRADPKRRKDYGSYANEGRVARTTTAGAKDSAGVKKDRGEGKSDGG